MRALSCSRSCAVSRSCSWISSQLLEEPGDPGLEVEIHVVLMEDGPHQNTHSLQLVCSMLCAAS
jgi:hypothetical protein